MKNLDLVFAGYQSLAFVMKYLKLCVLVESVDKSSNQLIAFVMKELDFGGVGAGLL